MKSFHLALFLVVILVVIPCCMHGACRGDYILKPGEYTVVGIYCSAGKHEEPECFRSNKIILTIPEEVGKDK